MNEIKETIDSLDQWNRFVFAVILRENDPRTIGTTDGIVLLEWSVDVGIETQFFFRIRLSAVHGMILQKIMPICIILLHHFFFAIYYGYYSVEC